MTEAGKAPTKQRLDQLLVDRGLVENRSRAQALIMAGEVYLDGQRAEKAGHSVPLDADISLRGRLPYVGRGGLKLAGALDALAIDPRGWACLDIGASTGGFTDCLLQRGAARVVAVDVGRGQLARSLQEDPRVLSLERTDIRQLEPVDPPVDLATIDVAFISLRQVLEPALRHLAPDGRILALVKPQFEAGLGQVGRGGIVRDAATRRQAVLAVIAAASGLGLSVRGACPSPITGGDGNHEYFLLFSREGAGEERFLAADVLGRLGL